jgi:hypothetical protein
VEVPGKDRLGLCQQISFLLIGILSFEVVSEIIGMGKCSHILCGGCDKLEVIDGCAVVFFYLILLCTD